ncbi:MAG: M56 family metallopeptidase [Verrucomicrobiota bacterium]
MNALLHWFTAPEWSQLVKTLLHSLWQGILIAVVLALAMRRVANPRWRYRFALLALVVIPTSGILTWAALNSPNRSLPVPVAQPAPVETAPGATFSENPQTKLVLLANRSPAPPPSSWTAWLALLWIAGTSAMLGRASVKLAGAERLRRSCQPVDNPQVTQLLAEARRAVGLARKVRVVVTDKLTSPAVVGVLVPTLVLPLSLVTTLTPEQIRFILLHELAHIRRGDYLANLFQFFVEAVLFFNPAVWWISHQVRREREACCDALAIELSGAPADYARTLVHVAESVLNPPPVAAPAFGNEREPSSLADRVQRLLVPGYRPSLRLTWRAMVIAFALGTALLVVSAEGTRVVVAQISNSSSSSREPTTQASQMSLAKNKSPSVDEREFSQEFRLGEQPVPIGSRISAQPVQMRESPEMHRVRIRLESIRFDQVSCSNKPLSELFRGLSGLSQTIAPDGVGLKFLFRPFQSGSVPVTIDPPLTNVTVFEILAAIQGTPRLGIAGLDANGRVTLSPGATTVNEHYPVIQDQQLISSESTTDQKPPNESLSRPIQTNAPPIEIAGLTEHSRVEYDVATGRTVATNGAVVRFKDTVVRADSVQVEQQSGKLTAIGNVQVERRGSTNTAEQLELNILSNQPPSAKRRAIWDKLNQIKLERVEFNAVPLSNVILAVSAEARRLDPEKRGVNIVINPNAPSPDDSRLVDIGGSKVTINPPLTNVRLLDALNAILKCADNPLKLSIEEYAVMISIKGQETTPLFMREFKLDRANLIQGLAQTDRSSFAQGLIQMGIRLEDLASTNSSSAVVSAMRSVFSQRGVDLDPMQGKSVFYNGNRGILLVRATMEELDQVENQLQPLLSESQASRSASVTTNASGLSTRTFKVDPNAFGKALESITGVPITGTNITGAVRSFFATLGVELTPPQGVYYNDRAGELVVRSTTEELDVIEAALVVANKPTPQVNIKVRFVELEGGNYGFDWYLGTIGSQSNTNSRSPVGNTSTSTTSNAGPQSFTGILTDPQFRVVLRALEQRKGFSLLSEGEVTTLSGRQAQIQEVEIKTIVNAATIAVPPLSGSTTNNNASTNRYQTQVMPFGPVLDVIPTVAADGYTIQMTVIPTLTEFLGYDDSNVVFPSKAKKAKEVEILPLPRMRVRQASTSAVVWDGQTLVLGIGNDQVITKQPGGGVLKAKNPDTHQKQLLVFITPTIVDPAGNRMSPSSNRTKAASDESFTTPTNLRPIIDVPLY